MKRDSLNSQVREGGRGSSFNGVIASHDAPPETFSGNFSPDYSIAVSLCNERGGRGGGGGSLSKRFCTPLQGVANDGRLAISREISAFVILVCHFVRNLH